MDKYNKPKNTENAHYNRSSAEFFVGVTRARKSVYIVQTTTDKVAILFKETIFKDIVNLNQKEDSLLRNSSLEETCQYLENHAAKLELSNLLLLCEEALTKVDESTEVTCIKSLEKIKPILEIRKIQDPAAHIAHLIDRITQKFSIPSSSQREAPCHHDPVATPSLVPSSVAKQKNQADDALTALQRTPIEKITSQQLEQVINGKTGLTRLLISRAEAINQLSTNKFSIF